MRRNHDVHRVSRNEAKAHLCRHKALTCQDSIRSNQDKDRTFRSQDLIRNGQGSNSIHHKDIFRPKDLIRLKVAQARIFRPKDSIRPKEAKAKTIRPNSLITIRLKGANLIGGSRTLNVMIQNHLDWLAPCDCDDRCLLPIL